MIFLDNNIVLFACFGNDLGLPIMGCAVNLWLARIGKKLAT